MSYIKDLSNLSISPNDINILLIGETGVGKSTFINSFANYLQYLTLDTAKNNEIICLIPTKFSIPDDNYDDRVINFGFDRKDEGDDHTGENIENNESTHFGDSSTQDPRAYVFPTGENDRNVCLIDTPGIGDNRGIAQDNLNFDKVLTFLSQFKKLNAICILLKPNVTIINAYFKFCLLHLFSRLDKSASENIVFVFTNTRSTFYRPGETMPLLRRVLKEIEEGCTRVKIPCTKENMFCMDNEAFKFLIALKNGIHFEKRQIDEFSGSWDNSVVASWKLLTYIIGDYNNKGLTPHDVQSTLSINEARRAILDLSKPLADMADVIQDNLQRLNDHERQINEHNGSIEDYKKVLYVPTINIQQKKLDLPVTVCTALKCSDTYVFSGITKYHYKTRCHNPCYLKNIPSNIIGSLYLLFGCKAISIWSQSCKVCECKYTTHMHITYETELIEEKLEDETVKIQIKTREDAVNNAKSLIAKLNERREQYKNEEKIISASMAKFAYFLKENSITPFNDAYGDYLDYLIERENSSDHKNPSLLKRYEDMQKCYVYEKNILDNAIMDSTTQFNGTTTITPNVVFRSIKELYDLPLSGKKIKELYEKQKQGVEQSFRHNLKMMKLPKGSINPIKNFYKYCKNKVSY